MGSIVGYGPGDDDLEGADTPGPETPEDRRPDPNGSSDCGARNAGEADSTGTDSTTGAGPNGASEAEGSRDEAFFEDRAAEASDWLAGCREARERGEPDHAVGATGIADPALAVMVENLQADVDKLVSHLPVGSDGKDLLEATVALNRQCDRMVAAKAHFAQAFDASMEWALKNRTAGARLSHRLRVPVGKDQVCLGHSLAAMPHTDAAFSAGQIAEKHVRKLAAHANCDRTAEAFAEDEERLVDFARELDWREFEDRLKLWQLLVDPDGAEDNAAADEANRRVHLSSGIDGTGILSGILTQYGYAVVKEALDKIYDQLLEEDKAEARERLGREPSMLELARTPAQRRHDAIVRMAEFAHAAPADAKRPAPLVSIVLGHDAFTDVAAKIANTDTIVPTGSVARIFQTSDAVTIERIVFASSGHAVEISDQRCYTGKLRRAIELRDQVCQWPGCDTPAVNCHIDHIVEHTDGGATSQENGQALCKAHNLIKERIRKLMARRHRQRGP